LDHLTAEEDWLFDGAEEGDGASEEEFVGRLQALDGHVQVSFVPP
jgi:hypothetical protein